MEMDLARPRQRCLQGSECHSAVGLCLCSGGGRAGAIDEERDGARIGEGE